MSPICYYALPFYSSHDLARWVLDDASLPRKESNYEVRISQIAKRIFTYQESPTKPPAEPYIRFYAPGFFLNIPIAGTQGQLCVENGKVVLLIAGNARTIPLELVDVKPLVKDQKLTLEMRAEPQNITPEGWYNFPKNDTFQIPAPVYISDKKLDTIIGDIIAQDSMERDTRIANIRNRILSTARSVPRNEIPELFKIDHTINIKEMLTNLGIKNSSFIDSMCRHFSSLSIDTPHSIEYKVRLANTNVLASPFPIADNEQKPTPISEEEIKKVCEIVRDKLCIPISLDKFLGEEVREANEQKNT